jgi:hypothetical protein
MNGKTHQKFDESGNADGFEVPLRWLSKLLANGVGLKTVSDVANFAFAVAGISPS